MGLDTKAKVYKSKVSTGLAGTVLGLTLLVTLLILAADFSWVIAIMMAGIVFLELYVFLCFRYIIDGEMLTVKCGFLQKKSFNIHAIKRIENTHSILSAPAASLDRIAIYFFRQSMPLILSPQFIDELKRINPDIVHMDKEGRK